MGGQIFLVYLVCFGPKLLKAFWNINELKKYFWSQICHKIFNILGQILTSSSLNYAFLVKFCRDGRFRTFWTFSPNILHPKCSNEGWGGGVKGYLNNVKKTTLLADEAFPNMSPQMVINSVAHQIWWQICHYIWWQIQWVTKFGKKFVTKFITKYPGAPLCKMCLLEQIYDENC